MAETKVSMRGLKCPLPALKTRKLLSKMAAGEVLVIECTDPLTTHRYSEPGPRDRRQNREQRQERPRADLPDQEELTDYQPISFLVACSLSLRNFR